MTHADKVAFQQNGWCVFPYRFNAQTLISLSTLNLHKGRGQRLTNMATLSSLLPEGFNQVLSDFGFNPLPLRAVGFHKSTQSNWSLPWHQDRVITLPRRTENPVFKNWSRKSGIWHCEPPASVLAQMAFVYISFDAIGAAMGGLELAEATYKFGAISEDKIESHIEPATKICPDMKRGEVLLVSALTLHRSAPMKTEGSRKTLRIDFASYALKLSD